jgi:hypothetical protein
LNNIYSSSSFFNRAYFSSSLCFRIASYYLLNYSAAFLFESKDFWRSSSLIFYFFYLSSLTALICSTLSSYSTIFYISYSYLYFIFSSICVSFSINDLPKPKPDYVSFFVSFILDCIDFIPVEVKSGGGQKPFFSSSKTYFLVSATKAFLYALFSSKWTMN